MCSCSPPGSLPSAVVPSLLTQHTHASAPPGQGADPKACDKLLKSYSKHCKDVGRKGAKFCVMEFKRRLKKSSGTRAANRGKMMWENEYVEEMGKTRNGNVCAEEARKNWKEMVKESEAGRLKSDKKGPRGLTRLLVKLGDYESDFDEAADEEEVEARETPRKKPKDEEMLEAGRRVLDGGSSSVFMEQSDSSDEGGGKQAGTRMRLKGLLTPSPGKALTARGPLVNVRELAEQQGKKGILAKSTEKDDEEDEDAEGGQEGPETEEAAWFDSEVVLPRAARALATQVHKLKTDLQVQMQQADAAVLDFEGAEDAGTFQIEMGVLRTRLATVKMVLGSEGESEEAQRQKLEDHLAQFGKIGGSCGSSTCTGALDAVSVSGRAEHGQKALSRAGPCPGFQHLKCLSYLLEKSDDLRLQRTPETQRFESVVQVRDFTDSYEKHFKAIQELSKSMRSACSELYQARLDHAGVAKLAEAAQKKAATKREKMLAAAEGAEAKKAKVSQARAAVGSHLPARHPPWQRFLLVLLFAASALVPPERPLSLKRPMFDSCTCLRCLSLRRRMLDSHASPTLDSLPLDCRSWQVVKQGGSKRSGEAFHAWCLLVSHGTLGVCNYLCQGCSGQVWSGLVPMQICFYY